MKLPSPPAAAAIFTLLASLASHGAQPFRIEVVDKENGWPVPLVELVTTNDLNNPGEYIQEGEVESQGFEVELRAHFTERLSVIAAYGYVDNKVTKSDSGTKGNRSASVPMHTASVWADYQLTPALKLGGGLRYYGESYDGANTAKASDFTVADAMLSYQFTPQWQLSLNINNLFDERYATCSYACFYGASRSAVATATYRW